MRQQGLQLGAKDERRAAQRVKQRLDAHGVPGQKQLPPPGIPRRKGENAVEPVAATLAPLEKRLQHDLGVRMCVKTASSGLQLCAQLRRIVQLAVVDQHHAVGRHGLQAAVNVDHGQPAVQQRPA